MEKHIIFDKREWSINHITSKLEAFGYKWKRQSMKTGDISFVLDGVDYSDRFIIERKHNYNELYQNIITKDRARFKKEFQRLEKIDTVILLIEEESPEIAMMNLKKRNYKMNLMRFKPSFDTFIRFRQFERTRAAKKPFLVQYCHKRDTAKTIINLINDYLYQKS